MLRPRTSRLAYGLLLLAAFAWGAASPGRLHAGEERPAGTGASTAEADSEAAKKDDAVDYELFRLFADTLDQIERNYVKPVSRRELMEAAIEGLLTKLDPYSNYIPPEELERFRTGVENEFGGIGIQIAVDGGQLKITSPLYGTPAYRAGLLAGDRITKIEGESTKGLSLDGAVSKLKGKAGTPVTITVVHPHDSSEETVTLTREVIRVESVLGDLRKEDDSWQFLYDSDKKIGYVRITAFSRHTSQELRDALVGLKALDVKGLVLDLRFNPGGLLTSAIEVADLFVSSGPIVSTEGRNAPKRSWEARAEGSFEGFPMVILVNRYSASASEIVAACLQDHKRAIVVGERTWGKGSVQNIIELEEGRSALKLTTAGYLRPNGKNIHRFEGAKDSDEWGVAPSDGFEVKTTDADIAQYMRYRRDRDVLVSKKQPEGTPPPADTKFVDQHLAKAIEYLTTELAKNDAK
jgi:carboxyl-terminal processing protease